jgi:protoporphyrinogen oxidase
MASHQAPPADVLVIGAGPAGLTAAYELSRHGSTVSVLEADPKFVGGISRTVDYKGCHFDIGGHRFYSKSRDIEDLWTEILPDDLLVRTRSSRIFYRGQFFAYPLQVGNALQRLGPVEALKCVISYAAAKLTPTGTPRNFEEWVSRRFGARLYHAFFKTYTEKVWGMPCSEISADWAAQRIKGLSLWFAVVSALRRNRTGGTRRGIKTLATTFRYPRLGPGMMWTACAERIRLAGGRVDLGQRVVGCAFNAESGLWTVTSEDAKGHRRVQQSRHLISSAPLGELAMSLQPALPSEVLAAAGGLKYRDFLTVALILKGGPSVTDLQDQWIYVHDPAVRVARIQNFKAWSPEMVPDPSLRCYGLEYFCFEGDGLWAMSDQGLLDLARAELVSIGLARPEDVIDGCVVRQAKAYPVYDEGYAERLRVLRRNLETRFPTLHVVGRNGLHRYNNQDHAMMTALLTVANIEAGTRRYDVWQVNEDAEYIEADGEAGPGCTVSGIRLVPHRVTRD